MSPAERTAGWVLYIALVVTLTFLCVVLDLRIG